MWWGDMAILAISDHDLPRDATLADAVAGLRPDAPIVVMIHGFRFDPADPDTDPHTHILSMTPRPDCWKAVSWPRRLGLTGDRGLAIGWGWRARGTIWGAYAEAQASGLRLATVISRLHRIAPDRPVHVFAHSLGARVALTALALVPAGAVGRLVLLSAAAFVAEAVVALDTPAGSRAEVFAVRGAENLLFDVLLRAALPFKGVTLGAGSAGLPRCLDLALDRPAMLAALRRIGFRIAPPAARICHWSGYLRPGVWGLYRALLHRPVDVPMSLLRDALGQTTCPMPARWARARHRLALWLSPAIPS